jgi:hypothetical protein
MCDAFLFVLARPDRHHLILPLLDSVLVHIRVDACIVLLSVRAKGLPLNK